jgi:two-component system, NarL family, nitrate/nitrite sensor histidine kinase NarX
VQEALTNVRKHAGARCVRVAFAAEAGRATVTVEDDGQGFDPGAHDDGSGSHVGLRVMRERAKRWAAPCAWTLRPARERA